MGYIKCPRCELNYMPDTERFCTVCKREMRGEEDREELCSACGERPALPGEELCAVCLKELNRQEGEGSRDEDDTSVVSDEGEVTAMEATSELEEIEIGDADDDIPSNEYTVINKELGADDEEEEEEETKETGEEEPEEEEL